MPRLSRLLITTFGLGYMRPASGTWGSMPTAALAAALAYFGLTGGVVWYGSLGLVAVAFSVICILCGRDAEATFGKKDPSQAVADETAGMAVTLLCLPTWAMHGDPGVYYLAIGAAFIVFRIADIIKPWPARQLQSLPAGWGILVDDLVAGVQAGIPVAWVVYAFARSS
jgi:phosphatidylglycerophosphatase A